MRRSFSLSSRSSRPSLRRYTTAEKDQPANLDVPMAKGSTMREQIALKEHELLEIRFRELAVNNDEPFEVRFAALFGKKVEDADATVVDEVLRSHFDITTTPTAHDVFTQPMAPTKTTPAVDKFFQDMGLLDLNSAEPTPLGSMATERRVVESLDLTNFKIGDSGEVSEDIKDMFHKDSKRLEEELDALFDSFDENKSK